MLLPVGAVLNDAAKTYLEGAYEAHRAISAAVAEAVNVTIGLYRFTVQYGLEARLHVEEVLTEMTGEVRAHDDDELSEVVKASFEEVEVAVERLRDAIVRSAETVVREEGVADG